LSEEEEKKERKIFWTFEDFLVQDFSAMLFCATKCVVGREWYIDIKVYKFTLFEILGDIHVLSVCIIPDSMTYVVGGIYIHIYIYIYIYI